MSITTQGCQVRIGDGSSPQVFESIGGLVSFTGPTGQRQVIDVTTLASTAREKQVGIPDMGQVTMELIYDGDSGTDVSSPQVLSHTLLFDRFQDGASSAFQISLDDSPEELFDFNAFVLAYQFSTSIDDVVRVSVTLEIDGAITDNN